MAHIPTDDFSAIRQPEEDNPANKVSDEQKRLAQLGNDPKWSVLTDYMRARIDVYSKGLFGEDLTGQSTAVIGQRFLAAQSVIQEFESLINEIERTTKAVNEMAAKERA